MINQIVEKHFYDHAEDRLIVKRTQDIEPYIEENKRRANEAPSHWRGDMHHVASIPLVVLEKIKKETGMDLLKDPEAMKRFLNDPDNKLFRTKAGKI